MMDDMRKAFEAWYMRDFAPSVRGARELLDMFWNGQNYTHRPVDDLWVTWQAATERSAKLCDEVGEQAALMAREGGTAFDDGRERGAEECAEAIRARG